MGFLPDRARHPRRRVNQPAAQGSSLGWTDWTQQTTDNSSYARGWSAPTKKTTAWEPSGPTSPRVNYGPNDDTDAFNTLGGRGSRPGKWL